MVYSIVLCGLLDLIPLPSKTQVHGKAKEFVGSLQEVHKRVYDNLVQATAKYKSSADKKHCHVAFEVRDFVWTVLTEDHFFVGDYNKLSAKKIGHVEIVEKINPNVYRLKFPSHIQTIDVFNVKHLILYLSDSSFGEDDTGNSRKFFFTLGGMIQWRKT